VDIVCRKNRCASLAAKAAESWRYAGNEDGVPFVWVVEANNHVILREIAGPNGRARVGQLRL